MDFLQVDHLPIVETDEDRAALALYREGISLNNPFYAFLSLYKTISVVFPNGKRRDKVDRATSRCFEFLYTAGSENIPRNYSLHIVLGVRLS